MIMAETACVSMHNAAGIMADTAAVSMHDNAGIMADTAAVSGRGDATYAAVRFLSWRVRLWHIVFQAAVTYCVPAAAARPAYVSCSIESYPDLYTGCADMRCHL